MLAARKLTELAVKSMQSMWVAPSYQIAEVGWRAMVRMANQIHSAKINRADKMVQIGRGWVQVRSADSEGGLRGEGLDYVVFDEAAHTRGLMEIFTQEIRPALADKQGGSMFISTPKGYNDFYELWKMSETDSDWHSWIVPSWSNPYLKAEEIDAARRTLPALVFRQEFGAEFVQLAGAMFRREYFKLVDSAQVPTLKTVSRFWDLAASLKTMADYSVGAKIGVSHDGDVFILDVVRGRYEWPALLKLFKTVALNDGPSIMQGVETTGTQKGFYDLLLAEPTLSGLSIQGIPAEKDKVTRAQPLLARAEQGKVKIVRGSWSNDLIDELCGFPEVQHDDQVDACTGALALCARYSGNWGGISVKLKR